MPLASAMGYLTPACLLLREQTRTHSAVLATDGPSGSLRRRSPTAHCITAPNHQSCAHVVHEHNTRWEWPGFDQAQIHALPLRKDLLATTNHDWLPQQA